jgi:flavin-dependent dehydrogenase
MVYLTDGDLLHIPRIRTSTGRDELLTMTRHMKDIARHYDSDWLGPVVVNASTSRLSAVTGDGWIAAGDASAAFDPLSSQGLISAMASGRAAADAILTYRQGDKEAMARYGVAVNAIYDRYLSQRVGYYRVERRWLAAPFWRRRAEINTRNRMESPRAEV